MPVKLLVRYAFLYLLACANILSQHLICRRVSDASAIRGIIPSVEAQLDGTSRRNFVHAKRSSENVSSLFRRMQPSGPNQPDQSDQFNQPGQGVSLKPYLQRPKRQQIEEEHLQGQHHQQQLQQTKDSQRQEFDHQKQAHRQIHAHHLEVYR